MAAIGPLSGTLACGSGRLLADIVSGRKPDVDPADVSVERYAA